MTETDATIPVSKVVEGYFAMWNTTDPAQRRAVTVATWTENPSYVDPLLAADSYDALDAMVASVHEHYPDHRFRLAGTIDAHHDRARWGWEMVGPDGGAPLVAGVDFAVLAPDGRLRQVTGFITQQAAA